MENKQLNCNKVSCAFCCKKVNPATLSSCKYDTEEYNCIGGLCKVCYDYHMKCHEREEGFMNYMLNCWKNGTFYIPKGNKMSLI